MLLITVLGVAGAALVLKLSRFGELAWTPVTSTRCFNMGLEWRIIGLNDFLAVGATIIVKRLGHLGWMSAPTEPACWP